MAIGNIQFIEQDLVFGDDGTATLMGTLPANGVISALKVLTSVAFNSSGTDLVIIGTSGDDNRYATAIDVSSTGPASITQLNTGVVESATNGTAIYCEYNQSVADASAGACKVIVEFIQI